LHNHTEKTVFKILVRYRFENIFVIDHQNYVEA